MTFVTNYYSKAIDILAELQNNPDEIKRLLYKIAAKNPSAIVKASMTDFEDFKSELDRVIKNSNDIRSSKIALIKRYRELTKCSLFEAKDAIEKIYNI